MFFLITTTILPQTSAFDNINNLDQEIEIGLNYLTDSTIHCNQMMKTIRPNKSNLVRRNTITDNDSKTE